VHRKSLLPLKSRFDSSLIDADILGAKSVTGWMFWRLFLPIIPQISYHKLSRVSYLSFFVVETVATFTGVTSVHCRTLSGISFLFSLPE
jgi:hypothetical protein